MTVDSLHPALDQAQELSGRMLAMAGESDWEGATRLQQACDEQIRLIPLEPANMPALQQLQRDQAALLGMATAARDEVTQALARHRTNYRAVSAYIGSSDQD